MLKNASILLQFNLHASIKKSTLDASSKLRIREVVVAEIQNLCYTKKEFKSSHDPFSSFLWALQKWKIQLSLNIGVFVIKLFF